VGRETAYLGEILRGKAEELTTGMALYTGQTNIKSN
jgi:hypothetical protein